MWIWTIIKAFVNAPDALHWVKKYEAAKVEIAELKTEIKRLKEQINP